ncbi:hypothetical protein IAQ67_28370 (plasmid) [Paenibacillus peoriae]|uniref:Uncharacterized protein n=1 Tax=Paenibacillus peoriae TaxID=59893 RepID=A0A7H0YH76_9BACL|nr:hypothetical protein [Paenibacillus peoriae]QNR70434.1 hypothetical protein IAQ67_28370 [Paenibacillus peoriae]
MPRPTAAQLRKLNKFSQTELKEDQVYVFRSLSADTLPVARYSWFGEYSINMTEKMLQKLKKDYQTGVGLLASHNSNRLPFGRTFDAEILADEVDGESVKTLYIDHYMVTHMEGESGERRELNTEIGMTTQEIADHIEVGHTFDTSIGFSIHDPKCSVCKNSINDYEKCEHIPGLEYEVDGETVRCNIVADSGEGVENSLVYAGAVNRALIQQHSKDNADSQSFTKDELPSSVKFGDRSLYNVDDIKNLPIGAELFCFMSKGNMELFTNTSERRDFSKFQKEREKMSNSVGAPGAETPEQENTAGLSAAAGTSEPVVLQSVHEAALSAKDNELQLMKTKMSDLEIELAKANEKLTELTAKSELADEFTADLVQETVKAGVAARGNAFNKDRYEKYLQTLSVSDLKAELAAFKEEFSSGIEAAAQATHSEIEADRNEGRVEMSASEIRDEAARIALQRFNAGGKQGNLAEMTKLALAELQAK